MSLERIEQWLSQLNQVGQSSSPGIYRLAYTEEEQKVMDLFRRLCEQENMNVREDAAGNLIARREGTAPLPAVVIGSHLDTVYAGGRYDGTIGVLAGLEVIHRLNKQNVHTKHPLEIIVFRAEESSRFGMATIGSKLMSGQISPDRLASLKDKDGVTFPEAVERAGYSFKQITNAERPETDIKTFMEVHIEQGPLLEQKHLPLGIATGIAAPQRLRVNVEGKASHSGTTHMDIRKDALTGASELILGIEESAVQEQENHTVATVGRIESLPGAMNVIPGHCQFDVDIRSTDSTSRTRVYKQFTKLVKEVEEQRGLTIQFDIITDETPVPLHASIKECFSNACKHLNLTPFFMPSGAGHDVMNMAKKWPAGLLFVPSANGLSHHPDEFTAITDMVAGVNVLEKSVRSLASEGHEGAIEEVES
ncbi:Zn-dependent hydrolase [Salibacterium salarium]|uniref:Zn-dependent hydrolase n=1 Tax=Salibacterium salarium TaxID=284579 RepID=A0A3R9Q171_9BACI|nr:Zn-dependent hydrolase [Salibacterium salarium]RSL31440.1 Zn-dependent hydrolase [Salibacterium salarium]